jgi:hypothetical protein
MVLTLGRGEDGVVACKARGRETAGVRRFTLQRLVTR